VTEFSLPLRGPGGEPVDLARTLNSHGFADLAPTRLDEAAGTLQVTVRVRRGRPRRVRIGPGSRRRARVEILGPPASERVRQDVERGVRKVLRLDRDLSGFYAELAEDPELAWAAAGAGRMLQSPTVFEDVVKTICTTNCTWSATERMVNALVSELGEPAAATEDPLANAFPTSQTMATAPERFYRERARAGYRGAYLIGLARLVDEGTVDLEAMETTDRSDLPDEEVERQLLTLPGVGPYAAAHIMMTLGRDSRLILDSWTRPKYARMLGRTKPVPDASIRRRFRRYGDHAGLAFWLFVTQDWVAD
jgi:N-glycosylase/DNA lyase